MKGLALGALVALFLLVLLCIPIMKIRHDAYEKLQKVATECAVTQVELWPSTVQLTSAEMTIIRWEERLQNFHGWFAHKRRCQRQHRESRIVACQRN